MAEQHLSLALNRITPVTDASSAVTLFATLSRLMMLDARLPATLQLSGEDAIEAMRIVLKLRRMESFWPRLQGLALRGMKLPELIAGNLVTTAAYSLG